jgi:hypothetical protein
MKKLVIFVLLIISCEAFAPNLPVVKIYSNGIIKFNEYVNALIKLEYLDNESEHTANIKCRGGFSSKFSKHSYRLELDKKAEFCGLEKEDDWILNANYIDKTFMRHKISYDLFRQMGENNLAPKSEFVKVFLNDEYKGLYVLMQFVGAKFCGINKKDETAFLFKDPPVFYTAETYFSLSPENPKGQKFPKIKKRDISETLVNLQKFLFETEDEVFIENVGKVFDLDNVADWHILLLLTNNQDGIMKNFYLYKQDAYTLIRFAIWDYDHSFGRDGDNELNMLERKIDCNRSILIKRLMENPEIGYKDLLKRKWDKYRKSGVISCVNLYRMIFDNHIRIQSEIKHNFNLWPINSEDYFDDANYYQEIVLMQNYLKIRIPELDNYFEKL